MKKDNETTLKGKISTKKEAKETIDKFKSVSGEWEINLETDEMTANFKGIRKGEGVPKSGLTSADKEWSADLGVTTIQTAVKPIKEDISSLKEDVKALKEDMVQVKKDIKAIKECPTIKKELKKDDE